jgi:transposase
VIIDLTPVRDQKGPARLLDMFAGRSKQVFKDWLQARSQEFRDKIQVVAMDGFTGFKTATQEQLPDAVAVMDPFHVAHLAGDALDHARQRVQQQTQGHRGRKGDPLYGIRLTLKTGADLLTDKQKARIEPILAEERHAAVDVTWACYQQVIAAYRHKDRSQGRQLMEHLIKSLSSGVPTEAINERIENLRGNALGFRNLTNYITYAEFRISGGMWP